MTIVLCSKGYQENKKNVEIKKIGKIQIIKIFLFSTQEQKLKEKIISNGGRVLNITSSEIVFIKLGIELF